jgi:hypothetical protein
VLAYLTLYVDPTTATNYLAVPGDLKLITSEFNSEPAAAD